MARCVAKRFEAPRREGFHESLPPLVILALCSRGQNKLSADSWLLFLADHDRIPTIMGSLRVEGWVTSHIPRLDTAWNSQDDDNMTDARDKTILRLELHRFVSECSHRLLRVGRRLAGKRARKGWREKREDLQLCFLHVVRARQSVRRVELAFCLHFETGSKVK